MRGDRHRHSKHMHGFTWHHMAENMGAQIKQKKGLGVSEEGVEFKTGWSGKASLRTEMQDVWAKTQRRENTSFADNMKGQQVPRPQAGPQWFGGSAE